MNKCSKGQAVANRAVQRGGPATTQMWKSARAVSSARNAAGTRKSDGHVTGEVLGPQLAFRTRGGALAEPHA